jgi:type-F conjugative transfer system pilin assembly protein TrbC
LPLFLIGLATAAIPLTPPMARPCLSIDNSDIEGVFKRSEEYEDINLDNIHKDSMEKEATKSYNKFNEARTNEVEEWKGRIHYDGNKLVVSKQQRQPQKGKFTPKSFLADDERIYIFISESVPLATLINYAETIDRLKDPNVFIVLRGCIDGCSKIKPTIAFVKNILTTSDNKRRTAEIEIDPFLFRTYGITHVPAIVYARGVTAANTELSEGLTTNLKSKPKASVIYGDVSLQYAIEKINGRLKNERLTLMAKSLSASYYEQ